MRLDEKLVTLRKAHGLSQLKLAEMMHVSRQAISRWEVGTSVPSIDNLKYLGKLYDVPLEYLLYDDTLSPPAADAVPAQQAAEVQKSQNNRFRTLATVLIIILSVIIIFLVSLLMQGQREKGVPMDSIEGEVVDADNAPTFDIENLTKGG